MNKANIGSRIKFYRKRLNLTQTELAKKINTATSTISKYENSDCLRLQMPLLKKLAEALEILPSDLIPDFNALEIESDKRIATFAHEIQCVVIIMEKLNIEGRNLICEHAKFIESTKRYCADESFTTPENKADEIEPVKLKELTKKHQKPCILVKGDSMSPTLNDGDVVFYKEMAMQQNGKIYIVNYENEIYIKRCYFSKKELLLRSDNIEYKDIIIPATKEDRIRIVGLVSEWEKLKN